MNIDELSYYLLSIVDVKKTKMKPESKKKKGLARAFADLKQEKIAPAMPKKEPGEEESEELLVGWG